MYQSPFSSPDSSSVLRAGWRYRRAVAITVALGLALGLAFGLSRSAETTVSTTVLLRDPGEVDLTLPSKDQSGAYERFVRSQALFATSDEVLETVAARFETDIDEVRNRISVEARSSGEVLRFASTADTESGARNLLEVHLEEYRSARSGWITTDAEIVQEVIDEKLNDMASESTGLVGVIAVENEIATRVYDDGVAFLGRESVSRPSTVLGLGVPLVIGATVAALAALAVATAINERRPLVLGAHTLVDRHSVPVRAVIPARSADRPLAYRHLGADLERSITKHGEQHPGTALMLLVVGVDLTGEDLRSSFVEPIRSIAQAGYRVCFVDGDASDEPESRFTEGGAVEPFTPAIAVETEFMKVSGGGSVIGIRPAYGRRALPDYSGDTGFHAFLDDLRSLFDLVIVECPPLTESPSGRRMAPFSDEAVIVVPSGAPLDEVDETVRTISQAGAPVTGYVLSDRAVVTERTRAT